MSRCRAIFSGWAEVQFFIEEHTNSERSMKPFDKAECLTKTWIPEKKNLDAFPHRLKNVSNTFPLHKIYTQTGCIKIMMIVWNTL